MEETPQEFEQEIKNALKYILEMEKHGDEMDIDDIKDFCGRIRFPLERMLQGIQSGKIKSKKF